METAKPTKTILQVFEEFLADQQTRISHKTFLKYQSIIGLYKSYLEATGLVTIRKNTTKSLAAATRSRLTRYPVLF